MTDTITKLLTDLRKEDCREMRQHEREARIMLSGLLSRAATEIERFRQENERMRKALEPFALASSEGVVKQTTGYVTTTTCAEYFHAAQAAITKENV